MPDESVKAAGDSAKPSDDNATEKVVKDATIEDGAGDGSKAEAESAEQTEPVQAISSISANTRKPSESGDGDGDHKKPEKLELKSTPIPAPVNLAMFDSGNLTERLEKALGSVAPLLREIFVDFAPYLSKTLIGSHGQELLIGGKWLDLNFFDCFKRVKHNCFEDKRNDLSDLLGKLKHIRNDDINSCQTR